MQAEKHWYSRVMLCPTVNRKKISRDRVIIIENLKHNYILGQVLHCTNGFGTGYSTTGIHYITINGEMIAQAISQTINNPLLKTKGKVMLPHMSISIVGIKTPNSSK